MGVGALLSEKRKNRKLTQSDIAARIGISRTHYTNIEKGYRRPSPEIAQKLGEVLEIDWTVFYLNVS